MEESFTVNSICKAVSGEIGLFPQGTTVTILRFAGCNLKCFYCDTRHTQSPEAGKTMTIAGIIRVLDRINCRRILVTGGEPLVQDHDALAELFGQMRELGFEIQVESNGTILPARNVVADCWVMDMELPGTIGEDYRRLAPDEMASIRPFPIVKVAILDRDTYESARLLVRAYETYCPEIKVAFSALTTKVSHEELRRWMFEDRLDDVILNVRIHKLAQFDETKNEIG